MIIDCDDLIAESVDLTGATPDKITAMAQKYLREYFEDVVDATRKQLTKTKQ